MRSKVKDFLAKFLPVPAKSFYKHMDAVTVRHKQELNDAMELMARQHKQELSDVMAALREHSAAVSNERTQIMDSFKELNAMLNEGHSQTIECVKNETGKKGAEIQKAFSAESVRAINEIKKSKRALTHSLVNTLDRNVINQLDFQLADHCNLDCKGCTHFSPLSKEKFADPAAFKHDIERLNHLIGNKVMRIHLLGGEPLLHPRCEEFAVICRDAFPDALIDFTTNGLLVSKMPESFWDVLRNKNIYIRYTRYPINLDYDDMERIVREKGVTCFNSKDNNNEVSHFSRTPLDERGDFDILNSYVNCQNANCTTLNSGKLYRCSTCAFMYILNDSIEKNGGNKFNVNGLDFIDIHKAQSKEEIFNFLSNPVPFCRYCDTQHINNWVPWEQSKYDVREWVDIL